MVELADIVRGHGGAYREKFGERMPQRHRRALDAIEACRTEALGGHLEACDDDECGHRRYAYHSCKDRSCPKCHGADTSRWLAKRKAELLPVPHFHVTVTIPQELRRVARSHQEKLYAILMATAAGSLRTLALDPKYLGGGIAVLSVLHTWTRTLEHHPHVHMLVPAGAVTGEGTWKPVRKKKFLVCARALSKIFRARFMARVRKALPQETFAQELWETDWVVKIQPPVANPKKVLTYLGRYVHRIAIANSRIVSHEQENVTFRYQESDTGKWKSMTLSAEEFLRRFLQHVLPQGFHKVRYYGLWSPANRQELDEVRRQLTAEQTGEAEEPAPQAAPRRCPVCVRGLMVVVEVLPRRARSPPGMVGRCEPNG